MKGSRDEENKGGERGGNHTEKTLSVTRARPCGTAASRAESDSFAVDSDVGIYREGAIYAMCFFILYVCVSFVSCSILSHILYIAVIVIKALMSCSILSDISVNYPYSAH